MSKIEILNYFWEFILAGGFIGVFVKYILFVPASPFGMGAGLTIISAILHRLDPRAVRVGSATTEKTSTGFKAGLRGSVWLIFGGMGTFLMALCLYLGYVDWNQASPGERDRNYQALKSKWAPTEELDPLVLPKVSRPADSPAANGTPK